MRMASPSLEMCAAINSCLVLIQEFELPDLEAQCPETCEELIQAINAYCEMAHRFLDKLQELHERP